MVWSTLTSFTSWLGWCSKLINRLKAAASGADVRALQLHMLREGTFIILSSMAPSFLLWTKLLPKVSKKWLGVSNMWELLGQEGQAGIQVFFFSSPLVDNNILLFLLIIERSNSLCDKNLAGWVLVWCSIRLAPVRVVQWTSKACYIFFLSL